MDGVDTPQSAEQDSMALDECGPEERDPIATDMLPPKEALPDLRSLLLRYLRTHKRKQAKATFQGFRRVRRLKLQGDRGSSLERGHVQTKQGEAWTVPVCTSVQEISQLFSQINTKETPKGEGAATWKRTAPVKIECAKIQPCLPKRRAKARIVARRR